MGIPLSISTAPPSFNTIRDKVGELLSKVSSTRLHAQFAKAREADGHFQEAARTYEKAHDFDSAIRSVKLHVPNSVPYI